MLSMQTASFLLWLVNQQQPNAGAPDFREAVAQIVRAQDELQAVIEANAEAFPAERTDALRDNR